MHACTHIHDTNLHCLSFSSSFFCTSSFAVSMRSRCLYVYMCACQCEYVDICILDFLFAELKRSRCLSVHMYAGADICRRVCALSLLDVLMCWSRMCMYVYAHKYMNNIYVGAHVPPTHSVKTHCFWMYICIHTCAYVCVCAYMHV
jgi:hypothetical protein